TSGSGCTAAGPSSPAGAARPRSTTMNWPLTIRAALSARRWPRASWSCGACPARSRQCGTARLAANPVGDEERTPTRLWGGRFESGPAEALARLSVSVQFDWRLSPYDPLASGGPARGVHRAGLLDDAELGRLLAALDELSRACRDGTFRPGADDEDVHTALERGLLERVGSL